MGKLISIKINTEVKPLYDIEVQDNHNFVANGILIKNSEQYLQREGVCNLSSINVGKFNTDRETYQQELNTIGESICRFLDNVTTMELKDNRYATPHQKLGLEKLRRNGAGATNIAEWLFNNNEEYGSSSGTQLISDFMDYYNYVLYKTSIALGKEKGNFGLFNREKFIQSPMIKRLMEKHELEFNTMRNVTLSSIAPTGTLSLMFREGVLSYGIEPSFGIYYWKRTRMHDGKYSYYFCVPRVVRNKFKELGCALPIESDTIEDDWAGTKGIKIAKIIDEALTKYNIKFKKPTEINPLDKLDMMAHIMQSIDSSISVTYMLPENSNWQDVYNFILEANKREIKSIAAFPDKKMYGIVSYIPFKDLAVSLLQSNINIHEQNFSEEEREALHISSQKNFPEKRPREVECDVHHVSVKGQQYFVAVGKIGGEIYEIFVGRNGVIPHGVKTGKIIRKRKGFYQLLCYNDKDDEILLSPITAFGNDIDQVISRLISSLLRNKVSINDIITQLEKVGDISGDFNSIGKILCRTLKKYIKDGTIIVGETCPTCGGQLVRQEGCASCPCGYSKCS